MFRQKKKRKWPRVHWPPLTSEAVYGTPEGLSRVRLPRQVSRKVSRLA